MAGPFTLSILAWDTHVWVDPIPTLTYNVGDTVDFDLYTLIASPATFDGTISRKPMTDQLPPDLAIENSRYLRGEITEVADRTLRLVATRYSFPVESGDFQIIAAAAGVTALFTDKNGVALFTDRTGAPLFTTDNA